VADKRAQIVIKKITVVNGGGHGGAWKVAFADFMTAMMAFFLVMWLLATQSEAQKKAISDYFSTPSVIEYQFNNFGAELTLEKLFIDLINEPLKVFQAFVTPVDRTPNVMAMGYKKFVIAHMAEQLGDMASEVKVDSDMVMFEIPDHHLFVPGTADPSGQFISTMERIKGVTAGLEDSDVAITSIVYDQSVSGGHHQLARNVAEARLDIVQEKVKASLESPEVTVTGRSQAYADERSARKKKGMGGGLIRIEISHKKAAQPGRKAPRKISEGVFEEKKVSARAGAATDAAADEDTRAYDKLVDQISARKRRDPQSENKRKRQSF
jgi:chemotaxis protein MotB